MVKKSFKENDIFFHEKDSNFNSRIIRTSVFHIGQVPIKNMGRKRCFAIQHIGNKKRFIEVLSPPPPVTKLTLLYTVEVLLLTHPIKIA